jgi:signal transduction histidine kinase
MTTMPLAFVRRDEHRVLAGVAGGFADQHGVDPMVVRGALVVLTFAGGIGLVLYALGALLAVAPSGALAPRHPADQRRNAAVACIAAGLTVVMRSTGLWLGDAAMVALSAGVSGLVLLSVLRPGGSSSDADPGAAPPRSPLADVLAGRHARTRLIAGAVLVAVGLVMVGASGGVSRSLRVGVFATAITIVGIAVVLGPWLARVAQEAAAERRQRIRAQEREAMAAHLHDSVLQTLALIQRNADDPRRTVTLARQQERELRSWLYGGADARAATLSSAVRAIEDEVEASYDVRVEVVVVGDAPMDDALAGFVAAMREACINAAKHSGVAEMDVYVELDEGGVEAFVRDRGSGFDPSVSLPDRRGIALSIVGRLARLGGEAVVESSPGDGTEVHLTLPRAGSASGPPRDGSSS